MEAEQIGGDPGVQSPVLATDGFICVERQQSAANLLLMDSGSTGLGRGCVGSGLGRVERVCVSPHSFDPSSAQEGREQFMSYHSHCSSLAEMNVVPSASAAALDGPLQAARQVRSAVAAERVDKTPKSRGFPVGSLAAVRQ